MAQQPAGHLKVTVVDPIGAVVPGSRVTVTSAATGVQNSGLAQADGTADFDLTPGSYQILITARGFKAWTTDAVIPGGRETPVTSSLSVESGSCPCVVPEPSDISPESAQLSDSIPLAPVQLLTLRSVRPRRHIF